MNCSIFENKLIKINVEMYEHPALVQRIQRKLNLDKADAIQLFTDTKIFLFICGNSNERGFIPTPKVDQGWHEFLMYTEDYAEFCNAYFGKFIHHRPSFQSSKQTVNEGRNKAIVAARKLYGNELSKNWDLTPIIEAESCDSCGCDACGD